jgi:Fe2+ or Zn2+ uptake regulation protein
MSKYWSVLPLHTRVVEILLKRGGALTDTELYQALQTSYGDLSLRELNNTPICLEIEGIIHVFRVTKNLRRVELKSSRLMSSF